MLSVVLDDALELRRQLNAGLDPNTVVEGGIGDLGIIWQIFGDAGGNQIRAGLVRMINDPALYKNAERHDDAYGTSNLLMWAVTSQATKCAKLLVKSGRIRTSKTKQERRPRSS